MHVDLLRHGEVEGGRVYRGSRDDVLTGYGLREMRAAVAGQHAWTRIISSPLLRCRTFAEEIAARYRLPLDIDTRWREIHFGAWEGKGADELLKTSPDEIASFWNDPERCTPPGGETLEAFRERLDDAWNDLLARQPGEHLLVVTHGGPIRFILGRVHGLSVAESLQLDVPHAFLCRLTVESNNVHRKLLRKGVV